MFVGVAGMTVFGAAPTVRISTDLASPQMVGTVIGINVIGKEEGEPDKYRPQLRYRFSVADQGDTFRIIRDFSRDSEFAWSPELYEHEARIKVTVRNVKTKETGEAVIPFRVLARVKGASPVAVPTSNPLVALFGMPSCPEGSQFRVSYQREGDTTVGRTGLMPCSASHTNNMYVAGMRADSDYTLRGEVLTGDRTQTGPAVPFRTGVLNQSFGQFHVAVPANDQASRTEPFVVFIAPGRMNLASLATDTDGNVVWYFPSSNRVPTRLLPGGRVLAFGANQMNSVAVVDLLGNTIRETNIPRITEQLEGMGIQSICKQFAPQCVAGFHHDAIMLPNGHIIAVGTLERVIPAGAQGSDDPTDIAGTLLIDLDEEMQVKWVWNAFDHLDIARKSKADGKCRGTGGGLACAPVFLTPAANDWLHGNGVSYSHPDGNLTLSMPEQDWVIKIDYANGKGSGKVVWRLGNEGDFKSESSDAKSWFSYQHDAAFEPPGSNMLVLFDNGARRKEKIKDKDGKEKDSEPNARGQVWKVDESTKTATLVMNVDLGVFSPVMGAAHRLSNGNYHFAAGSSREDGMARSKSIEVTPDGKIVYVLETPGLSTYRSFRVQDLYTPPNR